MFLPITLCMVYRKVLSTLCYRSISLAKFFLHQVSGKEKVICRGLQDHIGQS